MMKLTTAGLLLLLERASGQECVDGPFALSDLTGDCTYDALLEAYTLQVYDATGSACTDPSVSAQDDLNAKLLPGGDPASDTYQADAEAAGRLVCTTMYDTADVT